MEGTRVYILAAKRNRILLFLELAEIDREKGIDVVDNPEGLTPFLYFSMSRSTYWMQQVLKFKPDVLHVTHLNKYNALDIAKNTAYENRHNKNYNNKEMRSFLKRLIEEEKMKRAAKKVE